MFETLQEVVLWALPVLAAVVFHEVAHGFVARRLGDPTAEAAGRLTLNPLPHVDPVGTILVPLLLVLSGSGVLFGWARPVPVDFRRLRNPKRDMVWVAAAGPLANLVMAIAFAVLFRGVLLGAHAVPEAWIEPALVPLARLAQYGVLMNVFIGVFNMFPIPPLDGGRVLTGLLPRRLAVPFAQVERYGFLIVILLIVTGAVGFIVRPPAMALLRLLLPEAVGGG